MGNGPIPRRHPKEADVLGASRGCSKINASTGDRGPTRGAGDTERRQLNSLFQFYYLLLFLLFLLPRVEIIKPKPKIEIRSATRNVFSGYSLKKTKSISSHRCSPFPYPLTKLYILS